MALEKESPFFIASAPPCPPTLPPSPQSSHSTVKTKPSKKSSSTGPVIPDSHRNSPVSWSTGLCDCCSDCHSCCLTCWCPCVTFGRIAEIVDRGSTSCGVSGAVYMAIMCVTGCCCMYSCFYRSKLRGQYLLKETPCTDCCLHCCCHHCALCQESRELKSRAFDLSIGWHGNMERIKRKPAKPPLVEGGMVR